MKYILATLTILGAFCFGANAQAPATNTSISSSLGIYVFPAKEQTKEVQDADEAACYKWAIEQTGIDPLNPPEVQAAAVDTSPDGTAVRSAARGAAAGAAIGAITGDAGKGAAIGATAGGMAGVRGRRVGNAHEQQAAQASASQQEANMMAQYKKAYSACMEGKGYTVK